MSCLNSSDTGAGEKPQLPTTSVVTPWRIFDSARRLSQRRQSECECMSMKPGVTVRPAASMVRPAGSAERSPTAVTRSPVTPTSARRAGAPVPSMTWPPVILMSSTGLVAAVVQIEEREGARDVGQGDGRGRVEVRRVELGQAVHAEQAHRDADLLLQQLERAHQTRLARGGQAKAGETPIPTIWAPSAMALTTSVPRMKPPSTMTTLRPATAFTTSGSTSMEPRP